MSNVLFRDHQAISLNSVQATARCVRRETFASVTLCSMKFIPDLGCKLAEDAPQKIVNQSLVGNPVHTVSFDLSRPQIFPSPPPSSFSFRRDAVMSILRNSQIWP